MHACLPWFRLEAEEWSAKLVPEGYTPTMDDYTAVDVALLIYDEIVLLDLAIAYEYHDDTYGDYVLFYLFEGGTGAYYMVYTEIPVETWVAGTHEMWSGMSSNFWSSVYYYEPDGSDWTGFIETLTIDGSLEIVEAVDTGDCDGPDCPVASGGAIGLDFYGFRAEMASF
jgi:hypothetical protein